MLRPGPIASLRIDLYLSVITYEELVTGLLLTERRDPGQGARLRPWLHKQVFPAFATRTLAVDVAERSAALHVPDPRPVRDYLIAAKALVHGMTVVTRDVIDFETTGVAVSTRGARPDWPNAEPL